MTTPQQIDFMWDEMRANLDARPFESGEFAAGFSVGWRAALEAAHAKANAGHAVANGNVWKYWAMPGYRIFMWEGYAITPTQIQWQGWWIGPDGDACLSNEGFTPEDVEARGYKPCRNLCQAREVAGFVAKASAGGEGVPSVKYWASPTWRGYYKVYDVCALFFDELGGVYDTSLGYMKEAVEAVKATPCTTEAEARRVAGFEDKGEANAV